jgi:GT2 family glycosyltransferase
MAGVGVIIVTYQSRRHVVECLRSVAEDPAVMPTNVVVWDNGSSDESAETAARSAPAAKVVRWPDNLGFAQAVNRAANQLPGLDLLLLNPDARLLPDSAATMLRVVTENRDIGVAAPRLFGPDGERRPDAWRFPSPARTALGALAGLGRAYRVKPSRRGDFEDVGDGFVPFTAALIRRSLFDALGGLDESFWLYGEDCDFCYRARHLGARIVVVPAASAIHLGGGSSNARQRSVHQLQAGDRFRKKHWTPAGVALTAHALRAGALMRLSLPGRGRRAEWLDVAQHYAARRW